MTLSDAIENFDREHPNSCPFNLKLQWISQLDHKIYGEILVPRGYSEFNGYSLETPQDTVLAAPDAYGELYGYYLKMNIDLRNGEIDRFNNTALLFNRAYKELFDYINRSTAVKSQARIKAGDLIV